MKILGDYRKELGKRNQAKTNSYLHFQGKWYNEEVAIEVMSSIRDDLKGGFDGEEIKSHLDSTYT